VGASNKILSFQGSLTPTESWPNGSAETEWDYGTTRAKIVSKNSCTEYFVDYQIPISMLDASASRAANRRVELRPVGNSEMCGEKPER